MIANGLSITVIGMAIVFVFLIILVTAMFGLNSVLKKFFPKTLTAQSDSSKPAISKATADTTSGSVIVAVAVASIKAHMAVVGRG